MLLPARLRRTLLKFTYYYDSCVNYDNRSCYNHWRSHYYNN